MKKGFIFFLLLFSHILLAQDYPQFSQHVNLQGLINPAYNGSRESYSALLVSRNQWAGAIKTQGLNIHAPLPIEGLGAGLVVMQDNIGLYSELRTAAAISYRLNISKDLIFAAGLQMGMVRQQSSNPFVLDSSDPVPNDFSLTSNQLSTGLGFYLYSETFFAGLSMPEITPDGASGAGDSYKNIPLLLYGGVLFDVADDVVLKPTVFMQATTTSPLLLEVGAHAFYKDFGSIGVATRSYTFTSLVFSAEIKAYDNLFVAYSYDLFVGSTGGMKQGTHEISLRYDISAVDIFTKPTGSIRYF